MCKVNKLHRVELILSNISEICPELKDECSTFLEEYRYSTKVNSTWHEYFKIIFEIYGPNYPSNIIDYQAMERRINDIDNEPIKNILNNCLYEKSNFDINTDTLSTTTQEKVAQARIEANQVFMNNINMKNNIQ